MMFTAINENGNHRFASASRRACALICLLPRSRQDSTHDDFNLEIAIAFARRYRH